MGKYHREVDKVLKEYVKLPQICQLKSYDFKIVLIRELYLKVSICQSACPDSKNMIDFFIEKNTVWEYTLLRNASDEDQINILSKLKNILDEFKNKGNKR